MDFSTCESLRAVDGPWCSLRMQPLPQTTILTHFRRSSDYPGQAAQPHEIKQLADQYRAAARLLQGCGRRRRPLSWAPCRLNAIHAIELYLNALLLSTGHEASDVRRFHHDLSSRIEAATAVGLKLKKRTALHLRDISSNREYLIIRYGPERISYLSQINRLIATLEEVAAKVADLIVKVPQTRSDTDVPKKHRAISVREQEYLPFHAIERTREDFP